MMMKRLMTYLMLSCRKATELIEKKITFSLNPMEKTQLFLHTSMCNACRSYEKQSKFLDRALYKYLGTTEDHPDHIHPIKSSDDFKEKIISDLEN